MGKRTALFEANMLRAKGTAEKLMKRGVVVLKMNVCEKGKPRMEILPPKKSQVKGERTQIIGMGQGRREQIESTVFDGCVLTWRSSLYQESSNARGN